jgi:hypothetical protein
MLIKWLYREDCALARNIKLVIGFLQLIAVIKIMFMIIFGRL